MIYKRESFPDQKNEIKAHEKAFIDFTFIRIVQIS